MIKSLQPSNIKKDTFIEEDTRYKRQCAKDNGASVPIKLGTLEPHTVLPISISYTVIFSWISLIVWNFFPFKGGFNFGKSPNFRAPNLGWRRAESAWWYDVSPKNICMRHDAWTGVLSWWSCQSPGAHSWGLLNHANSFYRGMQSLMQMFKLNAKFDAELLLYPLSHSECDGHTVHMLIQTCLLPPLMSTVKSSLFTHAHSSSLSLAAKVLHVMQTIFIILTMVRLFFQRDLINSCLYTITIRARESLCWTLLILSSYNLSGL